MDPKSLARIKRLTRVRHTWEVSAPRLELSLEDGGRIERLLIVWGEGKVRLARPVPTGKDPLAGLDKAFVEPSGGGRPGIPAELRCADETLAEALRRSVGEVVQVTVGPTPSVDRTAREILSRLLPAPLPGITTSVGLWKLVLDRLASHAPWQKLTEGARFRFEGAELDGSVGIFVGHVELPEGFVWFPTARDHERFLHAPPPGEEDDARAVQIHLQPVDQVEEDGVTQCDQLGLRIGDRVPWVFASTGGTGEPAPADEQQLSLRALSAAVEICATAMEDLAAGRPHRAEVRTADARLVLVEVEPAPVVEA